MLKAANVNTSIPTTQMLPSGLPQTGPSFTAPQACGISHPTQTQVQVPYPTPYAQYPVPISYSPPNYGVQVLPPPGYYSPIQNQPATLQQLPAAVPPPQPRYCCTTQSPTQLSPRTFPSYSATTMQSRLQPRYALCIPQQFMGPSSFAPYPQIPPHNAKQMFHHGISTSGRRSSSAWASEDDALLRELKEKKKLGWREISSYFPNRTLNACQFRWRRLVIGIAGKNEKHKNIKKLKTVKEHDDKDDKEITTTATTTTTTTTATATSATTKPTTVTSPKDHHSLKRALDDKDDDDDDDIQHTEKKKKSKHTVTKVTELLN